MTFDHFYRPGTRTGDALAACLDCGRAPTDPDFAIAHERELQWLATHDADKRPIDGAPSQYRDVRGFAPIVR